MRKYQRIVASGLAIAGLAGLIGCSQENRANQPTKPIEERFLDRGIIGSPGASIADAGVGVAMGDIDGDGDLDIVTVAPFRMHLYENVGSKKNPSYIDRGMIGSPGASIYDAGVGVAMGDIDGDGDLDIVTVAPYKMKYFENKLTQKNK